MTISHKLLITNVLRLDDRPRWKNPKRTARQLTGLAADAAIAPLRSSTGITFVAFFGTGTTCPDYLICGPWLVCYQHSQGRNAIAASKNTCFTTGRELKDMLRPMYRFLILGAILIAILLVSGPQAEAGWWRYYAPVSYGYGYPVGCWSSCCDPCCGPAWGIGLRPGPVRRLILGRYRWYPVAWGCCGYSACCDSCTWEPCCSAGSAVTTSPSPEVPQETKPTLAPTRASPAAPTPGPTPKSSTDEDFNRLLQPPDSSPAAPK